MIRFEDSSRFQDKPPQGETNLNDRTSQNQHKFTGNVVYFAHERLCGKYGAMCYSRRRRGNAEKERSWPQPTMGSFPRILFTIGIYHDGRWMIASREWGYYVGERSRRVYFCLTETRLASENVRATQILQEKKKEQSGAFV